MTVLHVAHLRLALRGDATTVVGGHCEPGAYLSGPVRGPALGVANAGEVCPSDGDARAFSGGSFVQSDPFSAGLTRTEVPVLRVTSPTPGETLYGPFVAFAQPSLGDGVRVSLAVVRRGSRRVVRRFRGLERASGVSVRGLPRGVYTAVWTLTDLNGDTRTTQSPFVEER
jgi:hypothetical protein